MIKKLESKNGLGKVFTFSMLRKNLLNILNTFGDILLLIILFLVAWKFLWGVVALGLWDNIGVHILSLGSSWPVWAGMPVRLSLLIIIVFTPVSLIAYWLFAEPQGLYKIVEIRKNSAFKDFLELIKKGIYCLIVFSILRTIWSEYDNFGNSLNEWLGLLKKIFTAFLG